MINKALHFYNKFLWYRCPICSGLVRDPLECLPLHVEHHKKPHQANGKAPNFNDHPLARREVFAEEDSHLKIEDLRSKIEDRERR